VIGSIFGSGQTTAYIGFSGQLCSLGVLAIFLFDVPSAAWLTCLGRAAVWTAPAGWAKSFGVCVYPILARFAATASFPYATVQSLA